MAPGGLTLVSPVAGDACPWLPSASVGASWPLILSGSPRSIAIGTTGLALYCLTLAPTVLWGDDAELQRIVVTGEPRVVGQSGGASHLLWLGIARAFVASTGWLPLDLAGRTTLVSALGAALALGAVYRAACQLAAPVVRHPWAAGVATAVALGVSHTFWLLAVRPAVYTLQTALLALAIWGALRWRQKGEVAALGVCAVAAGGALANHLMIVASLPGLAALVVGLPRERRRALAVPVGVVGLLGALLLGAVTLSGAQLGDLLGAVVRFRPGMPGVRTALMAPAFLAYQFPLSLPLAVVGGWRLWRAARGVFLGVVLLYVGNVALALILRVRDQFIFFLPSYVPVALLVGLGGAAILEQGWRRWAPGVVRTLVGGALAAPLVLYPLAALVGGAVAQRAAPARRLPGRDPVVFYLLPGKGGYVGARAYGEGALGAVAPGAVILGDWLPYQTLRYLQAVEGRRPDVLLAQVNAGAGTQLRFLLQQEGRPLYLADSAPAPYYEMEEIRRCFEVRPAGTVFRLVPRGGCG